MPGYDPPLVAARFAAHAARAAVALGGTRARRPPTFFAHDGDSGRVAVSTPRDSTAIVPTAMRAGYGGLELARLHDAGGDPVSGTGGTGRAAFGLEYRVGGRRCVDTQTAGARPATVVVHRLRTAARARCAGARVSVEHRFGPRAITVTRRIRATRGGTVLLRFPVWGGDVRRTAGGVLARAERGGYRVALAGLPRRARFRAVAVAPSASTPLTRRAGLIEFRLARGRSATVTARVTPF
jgi:hypothetical protein